MLVVSCIFFFLALFVKVTKRHPKLGKGEEDDEHHLMQDGDASKWFKGYMFFSGISILVSLGLTLRKKGTVGTQTILQSIGVVCAVLVGIIISWNEDTSIWALGLTTFSGLLMTLTIELY